MTKFPVNFPVSREFGSGDRFVHDCVRRQAKRYWPRSKFALRRTRTGPINSSLFVSLSMRRAEQRRFSPHLRAGVRYCLGARIRWYGRLPRHRRISARTGVHRSEPQTLPSWSSWAFSRVASSIFAIRCSSFQPTPPFFSTRGRKSQYISLMKVIRGP